MECPFCAEIIKSEALVCKFCTRDLRMVRPVIVEIQTTIADIRRLRRELNAARWRLAFASHPIGFVAGGACFYIILPTAFLLIAHYATVFWFDLPELYLRLASVAVPLLFGLGMFAVHRARAAWAFAAGAITAVISVSIMLRIVASVDHVPVLPTSARDWRETMEYALSIALAYGSGNVLGLTIFRLLPTRTPSVGQPSRAALAIARVLGHDVGPNALRRRARRVQNFLKTLMPLTGLLISGGASLYTGLKNLFGN
ncbi:MAG: hypothetical protein JWO28_1375 [Hyphomicrobiales bacterium]|nr:hypothetical protein [Hyphomicrobiales bacterium]